MGTSLVVGWRVLLELGRNRRLLFFWTLFPVLMLMLFGSVYADERGGVAESFTWTAPGILIGAAMFFSCLAGPVVVVVGERERRTLRRLSLTPLSGSSYFLGILWAHCFIAAAQAVMVYGITYAAGGAFRGSLALGGAILALATASYVGLGFPRPAAPGAGHHRLGKPGPPHERGPAVRRTRTTGRRARRAPRLSRGVCASGRGPGRNGLPADRRSGTLQLRGGR
jgi:hypothetical protein